jgi:predicted transcriptional regulator
MGRQTERFDMRMEHELRTAIERIAREKDRSVAWVVRDALRRYVEQESGLTRP